MKFLTNCIVIINGFIKLLILQEKFADAAENYREVLRSAEEQKVRKI